MKKNDKAAEDAALAERRRKAAEELRAWEAEQRAKVTAPPCAHGTPAVQHCARCWDAANPEETARRKAAVDAYAKAGAYACKPGCTCDGCKFVRGEDP
jgi:hypothetical protein